MPASPRTHPTAEQLTDFAAGRLGDAQARAVAAHLRDCLACRQAAGPGRDGSLVCHAPPAPPPSPETPLPGATAVPARSVPLPGLPPELAQHPRYRIIKELGRGGMGVVYQAEQTLMDRPVAIKVIGRELLAHPDALERFRRETKAAAKLTHPNIVIAFDAEQVGDLHMLVMEYVECRSLAEVLRRKGPLSVAHACHFTRQVALGLQYALDKGMVHRDIKPQNLMLTANGQVKILDFGLAKVVSERSAGQALTASGAYMGTPEYCAPEQATDARQADIRADIYSLGCTLYALLAGRPPFQEDTAVLTILAHLSKEVPPLSQVRPDVAPELWAVVQRMLAKDPAERYQKPAEVAQALLPYSRGGAEARVAPIPLKAEERLGAQQIELPLNRGRQPAGNRSAGGVPPEGSSSGGRQPTEKRRKPSRTAIKAAKGGRWWLIGGVAAAVVTLVAGAWLVAGIVLKVKTPQGVVLLEIDPPDAEVSVDGRQWTVKLPGDQEPLLIELPEGWHELKVTKGGFETFTKEFTLRAGKSQRIAARLLPEKETSGAPRPSSSAAGVGAAAPRAQVPASGAAAPSVQQPSPATRVQPPAVTPPHPVVRAGEPSQRRDAQPAFVFDGHGRIVSHLDRFAPVTLEVWARPGTPSSGREEKYIIGSDIPTHGGIGLGLVYKARRWGEPPFIMAQTFPVPGAPAFNPPVTQTVTPGVWSHLAAVYGPRESGLYFNGRRVWHASGCDNRSGGPFVIGNAGKDNPEHYFVGEVLAVRISRGERYRADFTPPDVFAADAESVLIYDAAHLNGTVVQDLSGHGNDGVLEGVAVRQVPKPPSTSTQDKGDNPVASIPEKQATPRPADGRAEVPRPSPLDCTGADGVSAAGVKQAQEAWAKYLGREVEETVEIAPDVNMTFVLIPPGKFRMGSPAGERGRNPPLYQYQDEFKEGFDAEALHEVTLTEPFDLAKTEVTQAQYQALTGDNPSHFKGADRPVEQVRWQEASDYADILTKRRVDKHLYRLPTEAEWEYACRGGRPSSQPFGIGDGGTLSSRKANFNGNFPYGGADNGPSLGSTCRVGSYPGNPLSLYDMEGNVWEWCADWFGAYPQGAVRNPTGPVKGPDRVYRGGCWGDGADDCRAASRNGYEPAGRDGFLGFRLARSVWGGSK